MNLIDIFIIAVIVAIVTPVVLYIRRSGKKGIRCIGCPDSAKCSGNCDRCSGHCSNCGVSEKE